MKSKKLLVLGFAGLAALSMTSCKAKAITQEKGVANFTAAAEASKGLTNFAVSYSLNYNQTITAGENVATAHQEIKGDFKYTPNDTGTSYETLEGSLEAVITTTATGSDDASAKYNYTFKVENATLSYTIVENDDTENATTGSSYDLSVVQDYVEYLPAGYIEEGKTVPNLGLYVDEAKGYSENEKFNVNFSTKKKTTYCDVTIAEGFGATYLESLRSSLELTAGVVNNYVYSFGVANNGKSVTDKLDRDYDITYTQEEVEYQEHNVISWTNTLTLN